MDFNQLKSYIAVGESKSFTKAAEENFCSQSTVSSHIAKLEEELKVKLLVRTTKNINITKRGEEIYRHACDILRLQEMMLQGVAKDGKSTLYIGATSTPTTYILPELFSRYSNINPDIVFDVLKNNSMNIIQGVEDGMFDIGIVAEQRESEQLEYTYFCPDRMLLVMPRKEHYKKIWENNDLVDGIQSPMIARNTSSEGNIDIKSMYEQMGIEHYDFNVVTRVNDQESIKRMVKKGYGVAIMSCWALSKVEREHDFYVLSFPEALSIRPFYLVRRKNIRRNPNIQLFGGFMKLEIAKMREEIING